MKGEFFKMDYEAWDTGTVDLPLEVEAAYLRLCHQMYRNSGPVPNSIRLLQGLFRCGNVKAAALLQKLIDAGKIQITADGRLMNRRVATELAERERLSAKRSVAGGKGGSARREKADHSPSDGRVTAQCSPSDPRLTAECLPSDPELNVAKSLILNEQTEAIALTPRSRGEERRRDSPKAPTGADPEGFERFEAVYPRRNVRFPKTEARKRWRQAIEHGTSPEEIIAGAQAYAAEQARVGKAGTEFVKTADAWLHQRRWQDYAVVPLKAVRTPAAVVTDETWRDRVRRWKDTCGHWPWRDSEPPDSPKTLVPRSILDEYGVRRRDDELVLKLAGAR